MVVVNVGDHLWLPPSTSSTYSVSIGAVVKKIEYDKITVEDDDGKLIELHDWTDVKLMHTSAINGLDDMINLGELDEAGILRNLLLRYRQDDIYTYTGSILVALNPYRVLPIYTLDTIKKYRGRNLGELPPHLFAIGDTAFANMRRFGSNQCIVISGESGAGKTESTKLLLKFLAAASGQHSWIEQQILDSNPIMEAFGNAKTVRNDNSSRFGKYIEVHFGQNRGSIVSARIDQYLLEKSRIVTQSAGERNFHVFYYMLAGLSEQFKSRLGLTNTCDYEYLNPGAGSISVESRQDSAEFANVCSAMRVLMFQPQEMDQIWSLLAALLHLGNVRFKTDMQSGLEASYPDTADTEHLRLAAELLGTTVEHLQSALTSKQLLTGGEKVIALLNSATALATRDTLAKTIYSQLFNWISKKINSAIYRPATAHEKANTPTEDVDSAQKRADYKWKRWTTMDTENVGDTRQSGFGSSNWPRSSIGILDIFGFENFNHNSFEQFCINYANETLQQFFVQHIFKLEQEEYLTEGIAWDRVDYVDNQLTVGLIACMPMNIFALIDEECQFPKGNDMTLLNKLNSTHATHPQYVCPGAIVKKRFGVQHFAGAVLYNVEGFLDKNRDTFSSDLINLIRESNNEFLRDVFKDYCASNIPEPRKRSATISSQFKKSLDTLMRTLHGCQPLFVRCIKPNELKKPGVFDRELCVRQLRYSGMMETIRIRQVGFPIRYTFKEFIDRYRPLLPKHQSVDDMNVMQVVESICASVLSTKDYRLGKSKVFIKDSHDAQLECERERRLVASAMLIQSAWRGFLCVRRYRVCKHAVILLQKIIRGFLARTRYKKLVASTLRIQAVLIGRKCRKEFKRKREFIIKLQSAWRGKLSRLEAARRLEVVRASLSRPIINQSATRHHQLTSVCRSESSDLVNDARLKSWHPIEEHSLNGELFNTVLQSEIGLTTDGVICNLGDTPEKSDQLNGAVQSFEFGACRDNTSAGDFISERDVDGCSKNEPIESTSANENQHDAIPSKFVEFAAKHFQNGATPYFSREPLCVPLLLHADERDQETALKIWLITLRLMGIVPELKVGTSQPIVENQQGTNNVVMLMENQMNAEFSQNSLLEKVISDYSMLRRKSTNSEEDIFGISETIDLNFPVCKVPICKRSNLNKIRFIFLNAWTRPSLRDEIYCQLCKLILRNPTKTSADQGWFLMALCTGVFPPTLQLFETLREFIEVGGSNLSALCLDRLDRTFWSQQLEREEFRIDAQRSACTLEVICSNQSIIQVPVDRNTTAADVCQYVSTELGIKEFFGFSIFIEVLDKMTSLRSGSQRILEAISECEQYAQEKYLSLSKIPFNIHFRKEVFEPWYDLVVDSVAFELIYEQMVRSVFHGEYGSDSKSVSLFVIACEYYLKKLNSVTGIVVHNPLADAEIARWLIEQDIRLFGEKELEIASKISELIHSNDLFTLKPSAALIRKSVVKAVTEQWPMSFSRFYEVHEFRGPESHMQRAIAAVNSTGVYIITDQQQIICRFPFPELVSVTPISQSEKTPTKQLRIVTVKHVCYTMYSNDADDMCLLIERFMEGLKSRSVYAIAMEDTCEEPNTNENGLLYHLGDLIILKRPMLQACSICPPRVSFAGSEAKPLSVPLNCAHEVYSAINCHDGVCFGQNAKTGQLGSISATCLHILPCLTYPTLEVLTLFKNSQCTIPLHFPIEELQHKRSVEVMMHRPSSASQVPQLKTRKSASEDSSRKGKRLPYTLEDFAAVNFRPSNSYRRDGQSVALWSHSFEPLTKPLLLELSTASEQQKQKALEAFNAILKYMEETHSINGVRKVASEQPCALTDIIFETFLSSGKLRDEIYCQILKQLTRNSNRRSIKRGWELLWLATGLGSPSHPLKRELDNFLLTNPYHLARHCYERLQKSDGQPIRHCPPMEFEVVSIQKNEMEITQTIRLPDDSTALVRVNSRTKVSEICRDITTQLNVRKPFGFGLYFQTPDYLIELPEDHYFCDCVQHLTTKFAKCSDESHGSRVVPAYLLFLRQRLWVNIVPGEDPVANQRFHYWQELQAFLCGYHKLSVEKTCELAALTLIVNGYGSEDIEHPLDSFLPRNQRILLSNERWTLEIRQYLRWNQGLTKEDAQMKFLKLLSELPTFGSVFCTVIQSRCSKFPKHVLMAINHVGILVIHKQTMEILARYTFAELTSWSYSGQSVNLTFGNLMDSTVLDCETSKGSSIIGLLEAYYKQHGLKLPEQGGRF